MPKGSKPQKRETDVIGNPIKVGSIASGRGGNTRAKALNSKQRRKYCQGRR